MLLLLMLIGFVVLFCFHSLDPTKVMVPPSSMDVTVGESIVLPCQVTHDHSLNIVVYVHLSLLLKTNLVFRLQRLCQLSSEVFG